MNSVSSLPIIGQPDLPEPTLKRATGSDPADRRASSFDDLLNGNPSFKSDTEKDTASLKDADSCAADAKDPIKAAPSPAVAVWPWMVLTTTPPPEPTAKLTDSPTLPSGGGENPENGAVASSTAPSSAILGGGIATLKRALMTAPASGGISSPGDDASGSDGISLPRPMFGFPKGKPSSALDTGLAFNPTPAPVAAELAAPAAGLMNPVDAVPRPVDSTFPPPPSEQQGGARRVLTDIPPVDPASKVVTILSPGEISTPDPLPVQLPPDAQPVSPAPADADDAEAPALPQPLLGGPGWKPSAPPAASIPSIAQPAPVAATTAEVDTPAFIEAAALGSPAATLSAQMEGDAATVGVNAVFMTGAEHFAQNTNARQPGNVSSVGLVNRQVSGIKAIKESNFGFGTSVAKITDSMSATQITDQSFAPHPGDGFFSSGVSGETVTNPETPVRNHGAASVGPAFHLSGETLAPARETGSGNAAASPADHGSAARANDAATLLQRTMEAGEQMRASGRGHVEVQVPINDKENVTIQLRWENGSLHTTFRTDSPELRQALESDWSQFTAQCLRERGLPLAGNLNFEPSGHSASSSTGGQSDSNRQQPPFQQGSEDSPLTFSTDYIRVSSNPRASLAAAAAAAPTPIRPDRWKAWA